MAACPPSLFPHLRLRSIYSSSPPRTLARPCDHIQLLCQSSASRSFVVASSKSNICLHEGSPVEIRVSELEIRARESSISADIRARQPSIPATGRLDEPSSSAGCEGGEPSAECRVELAGTRVGEPDEACTSCSVTEIDASSLAGARLLGEAFLLDEPCSTSHSLPKENASPLLASSDAAESSRSLSSVSAVSPQTADSIFEANASSPLASADAAESSQSLSSTSTASPQTRDRSKVVKTAWKALVRWSRFWQLLNASKATNVLQKTKKVVVIGGGSFGTAMAVLLARNKSEMQVSLLLRDSSLCESINKDHVNRKYFPKHILPHNIVATIDPQEAFKDSEYCIHAVPVQYSAEFLKSIAAHVPTSLPFFSVSKGLELSSLEMMSQVIPRALGNQRQSVAVISGPSFSIELMDELPTAMVVASKDKELARAAQQLLASRYLRINTSSDVVGVEIAGALKNVLAIAAGIVEGMNLGNNCMAALVAQGCSEIRWLAEKMGAKSTTLAGLSGTGDIMLTCFVNLSRNRSLGVRLGSGESLSDILSSMNQVAEGVATAGAVIALARKYRVQMPVLTAVARILENELTPKRAVLELMSLPQVEEV